MGRKFMEVTIACCLWGDWPSGDRELGEEYVRRLARAVRRNLRIPYKFVCFADRPVNGIYTRDIDLFRMEDGGLPKGCLPKTVVYSPEANLSGRVLLLDLDNVITGSLDDMASYDGDFCVRGRYKDYQPDGDMISFVAEDTRDIWEAFMADIEGADEKGRERYFLRKVRPNADIWQNVLPHQVLSYKRHLFQQLRPPENARIVSFHGRPRPHEVNAAWLKECWK